MPSLDILWYLFLLIVIFIGANISLLRVSCELANCLGRWLSVSSAIRVPTFRTCFAIVLAAAFVVGLVSALTDSGISTWGTNYFGHRSWKTAGSIAQWLGFATIVGLGLSDEQQAPTRLVVIASLLHTCLLLAILSWLPRVIT